MKIWIYLNGLQPGPYSIEQIKLLPVDTDTPVWYDGLPQWTPAGQTPLLAPIFAATAPGVQNQAGTPDSPAEQAARAAQAAAQAAYAAQTAAQAAQPAQALPPRPSTYIVWSIILTILCCSPFALAGIITGAISSSRYNSGDYSGAKSMSTVTEWLLIISIVWAVVAAPLSMVKGCASVLI
ncbi:MAG: CD225/dispanin family protein [Muribaculaceae bacterium]|nr:CD225/dispanin family protein [Muribaculaceae bacterium]